MAQQDINSLKVIGTGAEAFSTLKNCIKEAKESIRINVFIWRDDWHGRQLASEILAAANRGVKIHLSIDQAGAKLEIAEESMNSFFHERISLTDRIQAKGLRFFYPENKKTESDTTEGKELFRQLKNHPNVILDIERKKDDHSKFYIFDDKILLMGGVNIETKEFDKDACGRRYKDYLLQFSDSEMVQMFYQKWEQGKDVSDEQGFVINQKNPNNIFEMEDHFVQMVQHSQKDLIIAMAYFAPTEKLYNAILNAAKRGVQVKIVLPQVANYTDDLNKKFAQELIEKSDGRIAVYLVNYMLHAKLITSDDWMTVGSSNMNRRSFRQLDELNYYSHNPKIAKVLKDDIESVMQERETKIFSNKTEKISYNKTRAFLEKTFF